MARAALVTVWVLLLGVIGVGSAAAETVLFDNGHGERFTISNPGPLQLTGLADIVRETGAKIAPLNQPISDASLAGVDGLVISGAFKPLQADEIEALLRFMDRGGKVAVMLHIAPPLTSLLDRLGVEYTNGVIRETENVIGNNPLDFRSTRIGSHPVMKGVTEFSLYGVWGIRNADAGSRVVAATSPKAWIDLQGDNKQKAENTASFGVAVAGEVGKGGFLIFGDDAIFQNKFLDQSNKKLAANLAAWLK
ncbi:DUF4350 domain-containing protein [Geomonas sp.]|uniref:DUF4350 domain-containing protein n=1 Tax=Geomonas sp. TaxID=2651584 RepID=UPI002B45D331|nr:DUF4350 domain-containing protein [Geomonas sp.]HJV34057.1 DUF4350 domain-containing protein [Geomonas sp.]